MPYENHPAQSPDDLFFAGRMNRLLAGKSPRGILVGFSGGADSTCLLSLTKRWVENRPGEAIRLIALHVHHGIRGTEADRDADFCRDFAGQIGVSFRCVRVDVPAEAAKSGDGLEAVARRLRYAAFGQIMSAQGLDLLLTAHNADDQLETILFRLARGSGPDGLCGIPEIRPFDDRLRDASGQTGQIARPLLPWSKEKILAYCSENHLPYVTDSSNTDEHYSRNLIRGHLIPTLKTLFPHPEEAAYRFSVLQKEDTDYLRLLAERLLEDARTNLPERDPPPAYYSKAVPGSVLSLTVLRRADPVLLKRVLKTWLVSFGASPETVHLQNLCDSILENNRSVPRSLAVPGGLIPVCRGKFLFLTGRESD